MNQNSKEGLPETFEDDKGKGCVTHLPYRYVTYCHNCHLGGLPRCPTLEEGNGEKTILNPESIASRVVITLF